MAIALRPARPGDEAEILALNAASESVTSPMDGERLALLASLADLALVAESEGRAAGFLLALGEGAPYDNVNHRWFAARLRGFLYVDRVVVGEAHRGRGVGRALYARLETEARRRGLHWLAAEMDVDPPNEASLAFHARAGFVAVGAQRLPSGKTVSMQVRPLGPTRP